MATAILPSSAVRAEDYCDRVVQTSWKYRHCALRNRFFDLIALGRIQADEVPAGMRIEREWHICALQTANTDYEKDLLPAMSKLLEQSRPDIERQPNVNAAWRNYLDNARGLMLSLTKAGDSKAEENCSRIAHDAYLATIPSLSR